MPTVDHAASGGSFAARSRGRLRQELLAAAGEEVVARGWQGLRVQVVAESVGVSRQSVYNEFGNKRGLARALVLSMAETYLAEHERYIGQGDEVVSALREMVARTLDLFAENRLFKTVISADGSDTFLPIYTSEGAPLVELACTRMTVMLTRRWPELDPDRVRVAVEAITRLVISHVVLPLHPSQRVADELAAVYGGYLIGVSR